MYTASTLVKIMIEKRQRFDLNIDSYVDRGGDKNWKWVCKKQSYK